MPSRRICATPYLRCKYSVRRSLGCARDDRGGRWPNVGDDVRNRPAIHHPHPVSLRGAQRRGNLRHREEIPTTSVRTGLGMTGSQKPLSSRAQPRDLRTEYLHRRYGVAQILRLRCAPLRMTRDGKPVPYENTMGTPQRPQPLWGEEKPRYRWNFLRAGNGTLYLVL